MSARNVAHLVTSIEPADSNECPPDGPAAKKRRRSRACLECRALKIACQPSATNEDICQRCSRFGFQCAYAANKRGRKPKSRFLNEREYQAQGSSSRPDVGTNVSPEIERNNSAQPPGGQTDTRSGNEEADFESHSTSDADVDEAAETRRGTTFTFMNSAPRISSDAAPLVASPGTSTLSPPSVTASLNYKKRTGTFSMRDMLQPVGPIAPDYLPEPDKPQSTQRRSQPSDDDPVSMGYVSANIARLLVDFFFAHLNPWSGVLDPRYDTHDSLRSRSAFLYTAVLSVSSLHNRHQIRASSQENDVSTDDLVFLQPYAHQQISVLAINHATAAFIDGHSSLDVVQAFFLLSTWKDADDSISYLRIGYAAKLAIDLELSSKAPEIDRPGASEMQIHNWRSRQRMWLALFVQDRVQGFQYFNAFMMPLRDPLIEDCMNWHRHPHALPSDVYLIASVQCRRIQSQFRDQISLLASSTPDDHEAHRLSSRRLMLQLLIPALQSSLSDWYKQWVDEIVRHNKASTNTLPFRELEQTFSIMRIWKYSIQLHLCSFALSDGLSHRRKGQHDNMDGPERTSLSIIAMWPVLEGARGILQEFAKLSKSVLRSAPDTMAILPDFAAVCLWKYRGIHTSSPHSNYAESELHLVVEVVKAFRSAIADRSDKVLLHARFLSSVAERIRRQINKRRMETTDPGKKEKQQMTSTSDNSQKAPDIMPGLTVTQSDHEPTTQWEMTSSSQHLAENQPISSSQPINEETLPVLLPQMTLPGSDIGVPETAFIDFDTALTQLNETSDVLVSDSFDYMQNHPLSAFTFNMELAGMLGGSDNQLPSFMEWPQ